MVEFDEEVWLNRSEVASAFVSGAMIGSVVGFLLHHGIPASAAIAFVFPGVALATGTAVLYKQREDGVMRERFTDGV